MRVTELRAKKEAASIQADAINTIQHSTAVDTVLTSRPTTGSTGRSITSWPSRTGMKCDIAPSKTTDKAVQDRHGLRWDADRRHPAEIRFMQLKKAFRFPTEHTPGARVTAAQSFKLLADPRTETGGMLRNAATATAASENRATNTCDNRISLSTPTSSDTRPEVAY